MEGVKEKKQQQTKNIGLDLAAETRRVTPDDGKDSISCIPKLPETVEEAGSSIPLWLQCVCVCVHVGAVTLGALRVLVVFPVLGMHRLEVAGLRPWLREDSAR